MGRSPGRKPRQTARRLLAERGYFWLVVLLTPTVLLMISAVDFEGDTVALDRVANSMLGIVIGLAFGELARPRDQTTASTE